VSKLNGFLVSPALALERVPGCHRSSSSVPAAAVLVDQDTDVAVDHVDGVGCAAGQAPCQRGRIALLDRLLAEGCPRVPVPVLAAARVRDARGRRSASGVETGLSEDLAMSD
jgi:hypothetical protein